LVKINAAVKELATAQTEFESRSKTVGLLLLEAKKLHPAVKDFEAFLRKVDGLHLSRAYDLMRFAGGRVTDAELREDARERVRKHREKKKRAKSKELPKPTAVPEAKPNSVTVTESAEISIEQRRRENANLGMTVAERSKQNLDWFAVACREYLPNITVEVHRQEARRLVAELTSAKSKAEAA
jgi:hypothetical protein